MRNVLQFCIVTGCGFLTVACLKDLLFLSIVEQRQTFLKIQVMSWILSGKLVDKGGLEFVYSRRKISFHLTLKKADAMKLLDTCWLKSLNSSKCSGHLSCWFALNPNSISI